MGRTYGDLEIHKLLGPGAHLVVEAEAVFAHVSRREHKVALLLLLALHDDAFLWPDNLVVDVEGAARLDLHISYISIPIQFYSGVGGNKGKGLRTAK
jgi:hypothetical protein